MKPYLGELKNSGLGHFWEIFLGGDSVGLLTSAENLEKFGKIWKNAKIQGGGTRSKLGGGDKLSQKILGGPPTAEVWYLPIFKSRKQNFQSKLVNQLWLKCKALPFINILKILLPLLTVKNRYILSFQVHTNKI